ncbi:MAG TPA: SUMF1/EgtB/PvdO family nonheme iron enzyme, partial [Anaerolineaceae bacterium]|nr:SUMF1/EgtB/PvdO family nonheme iron enzyme [Anaerolineaceae bacterium]
TVVAFVVGLRDLLRSDKPPINIYTQITINSDRLLRLIRPQFTGDLQKATRRYLTFLYDQYCYLGLKGLGVLDGVPLRLSLLDLYIPLKARLELPRGETWQPEVRVAGRKLSEQEANPARLSEPQPVLDVLKKHAGLILLGDPGAGKSTFLKYLTVQLALGQDLGLGDRLPVLVPLAAYANALEAGDVRLDDFIADYFCQTCGDLPVSEMLRQALEAGRVLVLLDGLDEVKDQGLRVTVVERAVQFYNFHRRSGNKFVITSRIIGYREVRPNADDLIEGTLIDFDDEEIQLFVERWTSALERQAHAAGSQIAGLEAEKEKTELLDSIQHNPGVRKLAANPLLLTILAVMKRQGVTLPERRVELYEQYVKTMLSVWNKARSLTGRSTGKDLDVIQTVRILAPLALWMHEVSPGVGLVKREDLKRKLRAIYAERGEADPEQAANNFLSDVHEHTGLLLERGPGEYGFIHLTFEEYLAGVAIALRGQGNVDTLMANIQPYVGKAAWNEVLLLSLGYLGFVQQLDQVAGEVLDRLTQSGAAAAVILAGDAAADIQNGGLHPDRCRRIQTTLLAVMTGTEPPLLRARAGNTLARLGDPRPEVLTCEAMSFCEVPAGEFVYGEGKDQKALALPGFWIGKYPVTVAQFDQFVQSGGYINPDYWAEAIEVNYWMPLGFKGELDNEPRTAPVPLPSPFTLPNHPVVGISWCEAMAYTRWLNQYMKCCAADCSGSPWQELMAGKLKVALPTHEQWEKSARGTDGRTYPWGTEFDPDKANTRESGIDATSAVGCFPRGTSPYGALDLSGNMWEWVLPDLDDLRGGSWHNGQGLACCVSRGWGRSDCGIDFVGFRISLSPL